MTTMYDLTAKTRSYDLGVTIMHNPTGWTQLKCFFFENLSNRLPLTANGSETRQIDKVHFIGHLYDIQYGNFKIKVHT